MTQWILMEPRPHCDKAQPDGNLVPLGHVQPWRKQVSIVTQHSLVNHRRPHGITGHHGILGNQVLIVYTTGTHGSQETILTPWSHMEANVHCFMLWPHSALEIVVTQWKNVEQRHCRTTWNARDHCDGMETHGIKCF